MDDFGTGYSSLGLFAELPVRQDQDRSLLRPRHAGAQGLPGHRPRRGGLARSLGITTIIEGIETKEQLAGAKADGCDEGQGYLFAKPMPEPKVAEFLAECDRVAAAA
jgi:EAL domain-containing protein (putative c-di-GMP-specific phosphodiesterase class I)